MIDNRLFNEALRGRFIKELKLEKGPTSRFHYVLEGLGVSLDNSFAASWSQIPRRGLKISVEGEYGAAKTVVYNFICKEGNVEDVDIKPLVKKIKRRIQVVKGAIEEQKLVRDAANTQLDENRRIRAEIEARFKAAGFEMRVVVEDGRLSSVSTGNVEGLLYALEHPEGSKLKP